MITNDADFYKLEHVTAKDIIQIIDEMIENYISVSEEMRISLGRIVAKRLGSLSEIYDAESVLQDIRDHQIMILNLVTVKAMIEAREEELQNGR